MKNIWLKYIQYHQLSSTVLILINWFIAKLYVQRKKNDLINKLNGGRFYLYCKHLLHQKLL